MHTLPGTMGTVVQVVLGSSVCMPWVSEGTQVTTVARLVYCEVSL